MKRTRTSQKIRNKSGRTAKNRSTSWRNKVRNTCWRSPTDERNLTGRFAGPRKNDPVAMNNPKHMRQRCRAIRVVPATPPRRSMRTSPAAASSSTEPRKKFIPTGTPSLGAPGLRIFSTPENQSRRPSAKGISSATQSNLFVVPSVPRAVSHAVNHIKRKNAPADIAWFMLLDGQACSARCHRQHGHNKHFSSHDVPAGTFSERQRGGTRCQAQRPAANVNSQNWRHSSPPRLA